MLSSLGIVGLHGTDPQLDMPLSGGSGYVPVPWAGSGKGILVRGSSPGPAHPCFSGVGICHVSGRIGSGPIINLSYPGFKGGLVAVLG